MLLLAVLLAVFAGTLGAKVLVVLWPLAVLAWTVLYIVDRPIRRKAWPIVVGLVIVAAAVFRVAGWDPSLNLGAKLSITLAPLVVGWLLVLTCGGPKRIRARHERAEERRKILRAERRRQQLENRKAKVKSKTGLDVDLVAEATKNTAGRVGKAVGTRVNRRLEKRRRARTTQGPPNLLDLDRDVSADLSKQQRDEIIDLAGELDRTRRPRPGP